MRSTGMSGQGDFLLSLDGLASDRYYVVPLRTLATS